MTNTLYWIIGIASAAIGASITLVIVDFWAYIEKNMELKLVPVAQLIASATVLAVVILSHL